VHIIEKRRKLEALCDRIEMVRLRFLLLKAQVEMAALKGRLLSMASCPHSTAACPFREEKSGEIEQELAALDEELAFLTDLNQTMDYVSDEKLARLRLIAKRQYLDNGVRQPVLTEDELENLAIRQGNVTGAELSLMREHAAISRKLLAAIPFTRKLARVPAIAGGHHEKLNGKGYPLGLKGEEIPLQTRILAIADIYDALTAHDRPYKAPLRKEEALQILDGMAQNGEIAGELLAVFKRI